MTTNFILAPNGRWSARTLVGEAAINALLFTYINLTRTPKTTYQDPAGSTPNTNPVRLDSKGEANIYWATDEYYTIELYQYNPISGNYDQLIYSQDNYPITLAGNGGDITVNQAFPNLVRNPQFTYWGTADMFYPNAIQTVFSVFSPATNPIALDWTFTYSSSLSASTMQISRQTFTAGQTEVPGTPIYYLRYSCSGIGDSSETSKYIYQTYNNAQTLNNTQVSFGIWARSQTNSPLIVNVRQFFSSGPSVFASVLSVTLTSDWQLYIATVTLPSVAGQSVGSGSGIALQLNLPLNQIAQIDLVNVQLHTAPTTPAFPYDSIETQAQKIALLVNYGTFHTGDVKFSLSSSGGPGWIVCNDLSIGSSRSGSSGLASLETIQLFTLIWNTVPNSLAPIADSSGAPSTRGASALDDFNANKRLSLTRMLGRALAVAGSGFGLTPRVVGDFTGTETQVLVKGNLPPHSHETYPIGIDIVQTAATNLTSTAGSPIALTGDGSTAGLDSDPFNIMQPTSFLYAHIKL